MRVAAIYDIHGNLPALEAVLQDIRQAEVDHVVVGGDVLPGPMPRDTLTSGQWRPCGACTDGRHGYKRSPRTV
ncbi:metallophosphoesterase family protein [Candidatus Acetothermia bacterium]|nr:metallophosphoesterase family protein [Candidatus Acetothermia bacterium]